MTDPGLLTQTQPLTIDVVGLDYACRSSKIAVAGMPAPRHEDLRYLNDFPQACPPKRPTNPQAPRRPPDQVKPDD